jgi:hypothetical protein
MHRFVQVGPLGQVFPLCCLRTRGGRRRVNLFSYVLGYSRRQYLRFVESQDFETTIREHVRAFQHLGGVAATCLYDNMKVVVARYEGDEPIYNTRFLAFATHYGYRVWACRRRRPQTKGKVERPFHFVETSFLNGRELPQRSSISTKCLVQWLAEVADVRVHRETKRRPLDLHAEELPYLIPFLKSPTTRRKWCTARSMRKEWWRTGRTSTRFPGGIHRSTSPRSRCFWVDLSTHHYRCFRCRSAGRQLDLWATVHGQSAYAAAAELCNRLGLPIPWLRSLGPRRASK